MRKIAAVLSMMIATAASATVTGVVSSNSYTCQVAPFPAYPINYKYLSTSDFTVTVTSPGGAVNTLALGSDYTITAPGNTGTLTLTTLGQGKCLPADVTGSYILKIARTTAQTQTLSATNLQGNLSPKAMETAWDRNALIVQEVDRNHTATEAAMQTKEAVDFAAALNAVAGLNTGGATLASATSVQALGTTNPRTLAARFIDTYTITDFSSVDLTGATDTSAAINTALAAIPTGATIIFPKGTYSLGANAVQPQSGQTIICNGAVFQKRASTDTVRMMYVNGKDHVQVRNCTFDGNQGAQPAFSISTVELVRVNNSTDIIFENNEVKNSHTYLGWISDSSRVLVQGNHFLGGESAQGVYAGGFFIGGGATGCNDIRVLGNVFEPQTTQYAAMLITWESSSAIPDKGIVYANNTFRNTHGLALTNDAPGHMAQAMVIQAATTGFTVTGNVVIGDWAMGLSLAGVQDGTVAGNYFQLGDATSAAAPATPPAGGFGQNHEAIEVTTVHDVSISGNTIDGRAFLRRGVHSSGVSYASPNRRVNITGNTIYNLGTNGSGAVTGTRAIELFNTADSIVSSNNLDGRGVSDYGIIVVTPGENNISITGNVVKDFSFYGIYAEGPQGVNGGQPYARGLSITGNTSVCQAVGCNAAIQMTNYANSAITGNSVYNLLGGVGVGVNANGSGLAGGLIVRDNAGYPVNAITDSGSPASLWFGNVGSGAKFDNDNCLFEGYATGLPGGGYIPRGYRVINTGTGLGGNGVALYNSGWIATASGCATTPGACVPGTDGTVTFTPMQVVGTSFNGADQGIALTLFGQKASWDACPAGGGVTGCTTTSLNAGAEVATDIAVTGASTNGIQTCTVTIPGDTSLTNRGLTYKCVPGITAAQYAAGTGATAGRVAIIIKNPSGGGIQPGIYNYNVTVQKAQ